MLSKPKIIDSKSEKILSCGYLKSYIYVPRADRSPLDIDRRWDRERNGACKGHVNVSSVLFMDILIQPS